MAIKSVIGSGVVACVMEKTQIHGERSCLYSPESDYPIDLDFVDNGRTIIHVL